MKDTSNRGGAMSRFFLTAGVLAIIALCVLITEVTMTPPPLARGGSPASEFAGAWRGFARAWVENQEVRLPVNLRIEVDGTVVGSIGQSELRGRFHRNRSWLGRKLNFRTDYIIAGEAVDLPGASRRGGEEKISMPMNFEDGYLKGSLFIGRRSADRITLFRVQGPNSDISGRYGAT